MAKYSGGRFGSPAPSGGGGAPVPKSTGTGQIAPTPSTDGTGHGAGNVGIVYGDVGSGAKAAGGTGLSSVAQYPSRDKGVFSVTSPATKPAMVSTVQTQQTQVQTLMSQRALMAWRAQQAGENIYGGKYAIGVGVQQPTTLGGLTVAAQQSSLVSAGVQRKVISQAPEILVMSPQQKTYQTKVAIEKAYGVSERTELPESQTVLFGRVISKPVEKPLIQRDFSPALKEKLAEYRGAESGLLSRWNRTLSEGRASDFYSTARLSVSKAFTEKYKAKHETGVSTFARVAGTTAEFAGTVYVGAREIQRFTSPVTVNYKNRKLEVLNPKERWERLTTYSSEVGGTAVLTTAVAVSVLVPPAAPFVWWGLAGLGTLEAAKAIKNPSPETITRAALTNLPLALKGTSLITSEVVPRLTVRSVRPVETVTSPEVIRGGYPTARSVRESLSQFMRGKRTEKVPIIQGAPTKSVVVTHTTVAKFSKVAEAKAGTRSEKGMFVAPYESASLHFARTGSAISEAPVEVTFLPRFNAPRVLEIRTAGVGRAPASALESQKAYQEFLSSKLGTGKAYISRLLEVGRKSESEAILPVGTKVARTPEALQRISFKGKTILIEQRAVIIEKGAGVVPEEGISLSKLSEGGRYSVPSSRVSVSTMTGALSATTASKGVRRPSLSRPSVSVSTISVPIRSASRPSVSRPSVSVVSPRVSAVSVQRPSVSRGTVSRQTYGTSGVSVPRTPQPSVTPVSVTPRTPRVPITPVYTPVVTRRIITPNMPPPRTPVLKFKFTHAKGKPKPVDKKPVIKERKVYTPTVYAIAGGIKGTESKRVTETGLGLRPIKKTFRLPSVF